MARLLKCFAIFSIITISYTANAATVYEDDDAEVSVDVGAAAKLYGGAMHQLLEGPTLRALGMDRDSTFRFLDTRTWLNWTGPSWKVVAMGEFGVAQYSSQQAGAWTGPVGSLSIVPQVNTLPLQYYAAEDRRNPWFVRIDRLYVKKEFGQVTLTIGRQPMSFGTTFVWQPLDLLAPWNPYTIDKEWKPGVDSIRLDWFPTPSSEFSVIGVAGGEPCLRYDGSCVTVLTGHFRRPSYPDFDKGLSSAAVRGRFSIMGTDVGFLAGYIRGDGVAGAFFSHPWRRWTFRGEAAYTKDLDDADFPTYRSSFIRAVLGASYQFSKGTVAVEGYYNGYGMDDYRDFLAYVNTYRVAVVGEIVNLGRWYGGAMLTWEPSERVKISSVLTVNLTDPSFMTYTTLTASLSDESALDIGGFAGYGKGFVIEGTNYDVGSEFGLYPWSVYVSYRRYF